MKLPQAPSEVLEFLALSDGSANRVRIYAYVHMYEPLVWHILLKRGCIAKHPLRITREGYQALQESQWTEYDWSDGEWADEERKHTC